MAHGRRTARSLALSLMTCGVLVTSILPRPAVGAVYMDDYQDTRSDPDDPGEMINLDSTTRAVWTGREGRRWLTIKLVPSDAWRYGAWATVRLDTNGDRTPDFAMTLVAIEDSYEVDVVSCRIRGQGRWMVGRVPANQHNFVSCHVPLSFVKPTQEIAWWVMFQDAEWLSDDRDRAPNVGWYV